MLKRVARIVLAGCLTLAVSSLAHADEPKRRIVKEDLPTLKSVYQVSAAKTHSGLPVPRFVSLKFGRVNGRQGPSLGHPVLWQYRRKGLPLVVVAEMDIWRKVKDIHGDESWVRSSALSGNRTAMTLEEVSIFARPKAGARFIAIADSQAILNIESCKADKWCKVRGGEGFKGWVREELLWGAENFED